MAYIDDFTTKSNLTKATTLVFAAADFPDHAIGDYLVLGITSEAEATTTHTATAGWTQLGTTIGSGTTAAGMYSSMWYKKVAAANAEACTITLSVTNASHGHAFCIKDVDPTTFLDGTVSAVYTATTATAFNSVAITTTQPDSLLLYYIGVDSTTTTPTVCHSNPGPIHFLEFSDNGGANVTAGSKVMAGACAGWYIQRTAGVTPTPSWQTSILASRTAFTVGIRNKPSGIIPAYIDDVLPLGTQLMRGTAVSTTAINGESFPTALTLTQLTGTPAVTTLYDAGQVVADEGLNSYSPAISSTPAASATVNAGFQVTHTVLDMTAGWIVGIFKGSTSKMAGYSQGSIKKGGEFLVVGSGTASGTNYRSFQVMARDNLDGMGNGFSIFSVMPNQTQTQYGIAGVAVPAIASMSRFGIFHSATQGSGNLAFYYPEVQFIKQVVIAGGTSTTPVDASAIERVGKSSRIPLIKKVGSSELTAYVPIQIGGGDAVNLLLDSTAWQFPRIYDPANGEVNYHGTPGAIGITYAGKLNDVIKHTNSIITSSSTYYWTISAAATSAATWDFSGLTVINANVTFRPVMTFDSMTFQKCPSVIPTGCTITNTIFTGCAAVTAGTGTTFTSCVFSKTTGAGALDIATPTEMSTITNTTFSGNITYGIRLTSATAQTYTFSGIKFSGNTKDVFIAATTGTVTINITGGGGTPTYTSAGATVVINNNIVLTLTGLVTLSDIVILNAGTSTEILNIDSNVPTTYAYSYQTPIAVDIGVFKAGYIPFYIRNYTLAATDASLPIAQVADRNYGT